MLIGVVIPIDSKSAQSIKEYEEQIKKIEEEKQSINNKNSNIKEKKSEVKSDKGLNKKEQASVSDQMTKITIEINETEEIIKDKIDQIKTTNQEIIDLEEEIKKLHSEIDALQIRIIEREKMLSVRLQSIQETGGEIKYLSVLLGSQNFTDLIVRSTAVNAIMDSDKIIMEEHEADQVLLEGKEKEVKGNKSLLENKKNNIEVEKLELDGLKKKLEEQKTKQAKIKAKLEEEYEVLEHAELTLEEEQMLLENEASVLEEAKKLASSEKSKLEEAEAARQAEAERQAAAAQKSQASQKGTSSNSSSVKPLPVSSGLFIRPLTGYRVTSEFGYRSAPAANGATSDHLGIDLAAPRGTPVYAAHSGVVSRASMVGSYGNVVMITSFSNGTTYSTVYAHLNEINTVQGKAVKQGEHIGRVGTTGASTGYHLHFEIKQNGKAINPRSFLQF